MLKGRNDKKEKVHQCYCVWYAYDFFHAMSNVLCNVKSISLTWATFKHSTSIRNVKPCILIFKTWIISFFLCLPAISIHCSLQALRYSYFYVGQALGTPQQVLDQGRPQASQPLQQQQKQQQPLTHTNTHKASTGVAEGRPLVGRLMEVVQVLDAVAQLRTHRHSSHEIGYDLLSTDFSFPTRGRQSVGLCAAYTESFPISFLVICPIVNIVSSNIIQCHWV